MARQKRFDVPEIPQHIIQRGNNRTLIFGCAEDRIFFRTLVFEATTEYAVTVHAYVLMTNHVHLLATPTESGGVGRVMQSVGRRYVQYFNHRYDRSGTLWEGRYRSTVVDAERYLLACYRYIELNPVRAGIVNQPGLYRWSSYARNASGHFDDLVRPHPLYESLGVTRAARQRNYRQLFESELPHETIAELRERTNTGWALGGQQFRAEVESLVDRPAAPRPRGGDRRSPEYRACRINRV